MDVLDYMQQVWNSTRPFAGSAGTGMYSWYYGYGRPGPGPVANLGPRSGLVPEPPLGSQGGDWDESSSQFFSNLVPETPFRGPTLPPRNFLGGYGPVELQGMVEVPTEGSLMAIAANALGYQMPQTILMPAGIWTPSGVSVAMSPFGPVPSTPRPRPQPPIINEDALWGQASPPAPLFPNPPTGARIPTAAEIMASLEGQRGQWSQQPRPISGQGGSLASRPLMGFAHEHPLLHHPWQMVNGVNYPNSPTNPVHWTFARNPMGGTSNPSGFQGSDAYGPQMGRPLDLNGVSYPPPPNGYNYPPGYGSGSGMRPAQPPNPLEGGAPLSNPFMPSPGPEPFQSVWAGSDGYTGQGLAGVGNTISSAAYYESFGVNASGKGSGSSIPI